MISEFGWLSTMTPHVIYSRKVTSELQVVNSRLILIILMINMYTWLIMQSSSFQKTMGILKMVIKCRISSSRTISTRKAIVLMLNKISQRKWNNWLSDRYSQQRTSLIPRKEDLALSCLVTILLSMRISTFGWLRLIPILVSKSHPQFLRFISLVW